MPVKSCQINGEKGYKCGDEGKCYTLKEFGENAWQKACDQCTAMGASCTDEEYGCKKNKSLEGGENLDMTVLSKIPIKFETLEQLDDRFMRVKIWILNIGKNYNGSIFTKEAVMKALPSVALTPILGYIESNDNDGQDFSDHRIVLEVDDENGYKMKYLGSAYGVIPENPNAKFEVRENEYGGLEEYLTVEGVMWTKFDEAIEIMNRDTIKNQSMELSENYEGFFNEEGFFVFTNFKFFGCCILGSDVEPAIPQSTVEKMFTTEKITTVINNKLDEYRVKFEKKEDKQVHEMLMKEYGVTAEQLKEAGISDYSKFDVDEFKEELRKIKEQTDQSAKDQNQDQNQDQKQDQNQDQNDKNNPLDKDQDQSKDKDFDKDGGDKDVDNQKSNDSNDVNQEDEKDQKQDQKMDQNGDKTNDLDDVKKDMAQLKKDYEKLLKEHKDLVDYKKNKEEEEHKRAIESVIAKFETLSKEDIKEIQENALKYSIEEAEEKLFAIVGRKKAEEEVANSKDKFAKFFVNHSKDDAKATSSSYDHYFTKHLKN